MRKRGLLPNISKISTQANFFKAEHSDPQATVRAHNQRWSQTSLNIDTAKLYPQYESTAIAQSTSSTYGMCLMSSSVNASNRGI